MLGTYAAEVTEEEEKEVDPIISVSGFAYIDMQVSIYLSLKMYALIAIVYHQHVAISNSLICFVVSYISLNEVLLFFNKFHLHAIFIVACCVITRHVCMIMAVSQYMYILICSATHVWKES